MTKIDMKKETPPEVTETVSPLPAGTQTLMRGLTLLEYVAQGNHDIKSIAQAMGMPRSTAHRVLSGLVKSGYLRPVPGRGYLLGYRLISLGIKAQEQMPLADVARPYLEALSAQTGDTIHFGVPEGTEMICLAKIAGTRGLEMRSRVGICMPLASTGTGRALMLGIAPARWRTLYDAALSTRKTTEDYPRLPPWEIYESTMQGYLRQGWVYDVEENELGICCVSAPVYDARNTVVASVSVASATQYMPQARMAELGPLVQSTAWEISRELGWNASPLPTVGRNT